MLTIKCWNLTSVLGIMSSPLLLISQFSYHELWSIGNSFLVMLILLWSVCSLLLWQVVCLLGPPVQHGLLVDFPALVCTLLWAILSPLPTSSIATMVFQLHWLWAISILQTFKSHPESVLALSPRVLVRESAAISLNFSLSSFMVCTPSCFSTLRI